MTERIIPPKLGGHEDENVFDLAAYRETIRTQRANEAYRETLLTHFDSISADVRALDAVRDAVEYGDGLRTVATRLEQEAAAKQTVIPPDRMTTFTISLKLARSAAEAAGATPAELKGRIQTSKFALLESIKVLFVELVRAGADQR